ncbi:MAG TPA: amidohydrolase family protein [Longimicrobium sp.]|nr:amidohydrolase family protein [Longimicrobium sp.]
MTRLLCRCALLLLAGCTARPAAAPDPAGAGGYALANGRWWTGERFEPRTIYVVGGTFSAAAPARVDSTVDLRGGFVVPPFGDAHAHHFESQATTSRINELYLRDGIFYGMSLTNWTRRKAEVLPFWRRPETIDVAFADAGITGTRGHPIVVYESLARGRYDFNADSLRPWTDRRAEGDAYFIADTEAELDAVWSRVVASEPDIIKIYLQNSERYDALLADTSRLGHTGLNPALVPSIVRRAHAAGLRVAAHVNTAADFRTAVAAGVDVMAHMPGGIIVESDDPAANRLTDADAREARQRGVTVIAGPLIILENYYRGRDPAARDTALQVQLHNLRVLRRNAVPIAIGSDVYGSSARPEAAYMAGLGVFTPAEMLRMWSQTTPALIFPTRRIGRLAPGYEASLLVLECDPLARWECTGQVRLRIKEGMRIDLPPPAGSNAP